MQWKFSSAQAFIGDLSKLQADMGGVLAASRSVSYAFAVAVIVVVIGAGGGMRRDSDLEASRDRRVGEGL